MKLFCMLFIISIILFSCGTDSKDDSVRMEKEEVEAKAPTIGVDVLRVSDVNFPDQRYSINFDLYIDYKDSSTGLPQIDFLNRITLPRSKRKPAIFKNYDDTDRNCKNCHEKNLKLNINSLMDQGWNVASFPFDYQKLSVDICIPDIDTSQLKFHLDKTPVYRPSEIEFEGAWTTGPAQKSICYKTNKNNQVYSSYNFTIPIHRKDPVFIFWKLFAGMYIAFLVSFVALFINIHHVEPRFGLPVGGLFATIANKYVIESLLPLTSELTLVDWLHDITIIFIFLIIAFSAVSLRLWDHEKANELLLEKSQIKESIKKKTWKHYALEKINTIKPVYLLASYIVVNAVMVYKAMCH